jgi:hypothetical protein
MSGIEIVSRRIAGDRLRTLVEDGFGDMVKFVADIERGIIAAGGDLHADAKALLLESGSRQEDLWGANYYPGTTPDQCIEFTSLINIRPAQSNPGMELADPDLRERVRLLTFALIGRGEAL